MWYIQTIEYYSSFKKKERKWKKVKGKSPSHVRLFTTPWTVAHQAPPSMGFSRQEYWSGVPFPSLEDLPDPWIKRRSLAFQADALTSEPPGKPRKKETLPLVTTWMKLEGIKWKKTERQAVPTYIHIDVYITHRNRVEWWLLGAKMWVKGGDFGKRVQILSLKMSKIW